MRKSTTIVSVVMLLLLASAAFGASFDWTISGSNTDPDVNTGTATNGVATIYLWLKLAVGNGMASAEFDLCATGMSVLAFTPGTGFLNAGGSTNLLMAATACPHGPVVAGSILILDLPGEICLCPAAANGNLVTVECATLALITNTWTGYSNTAIPCESDAVESETWGSIKSLYR